MNRFTIEVLLGIALLAATASTAIACLWDYDTLAVERARFPDALELITGNFPRHSKAFYEWRVADREKKIEAVAAKPNSVAIEKLARWHDDLAVAYEKLSQHAKAIETIENVEGFAPGRYETYANLGTFHIHAGDLETGKEYIEKAIEINPDAHFGREVYQKLLVEYVLEQQAADGSLPLPMAPDLKQFSVGGFAKFVLEHQGGDPESHAAELARATKGVLGMLRFGNHESPVLLEALATLLLAPSNPKDDAKRLAARALLTASYHTEDEASQQYRAMAEAALSMQTTRPQTTDELRLPELERSLKKEIAQARQLAKNIETDERRWIRSTDDPEEAFREKYLTVTKTTSRWWGVGLVEQGIIAVGVILLGGMLVRRWSRSRRKPLTKLDASGA